MAVRSLPGASYHTLETVFHSFGDVELESTGSSNACGSPEKSSWPSNESTPLLDPTPDNRKRRHRGPPLPLSMLVFFCSVLTASALLGYPTHRRLTPNVPDRHALILSSAIQAQSYRALASENYDDALVAKCVQVFHRNTFPLILVGTYSNRDHKLKCRDGCRDVNVWDYRIFPMLYVPNLTFFNLHTRPQTKLSAGGSLQGPFPQPYGRSQIGDCPALAGDRQ